MAEFWLNTVELFDVDGKGKFVSSAHFTEQRVISINDYPLYKFNLIGFLLF